ncbi:trypsin-like serine protease [Bdellovibrio bacteriovorus]|uniref:S1 family peptidase n=1 Tax=Bdellovibrio bacteriovorus TaxID=959 RepID=UPI0035A73EEE
MYRHFLKNSVLLLALSVLSACSGSDGGKELKAEPASCEVTGSSFGIVGGEILGSNNPLSESTVFVIHKDIEGKTGICTGTLIDDDKVLTAAHCTTPGGRSQIAFTNNASCTIAAPKRTRRAVVDEAVHPDYTYFNKTLLNAGRDLAIMKFSGGIPEGYKVRALPSETYQASKDDQLVMSGYGVTSETAEDSGVLRFTTAPASRVVSNFYMAIVKTTVTVPGTIAVQQPSNGVCSGDSGGPLYVHDGRDLTLVGITSMGLDVTATKEKDMRICHGVSLFTDLKPHLPWIKKQIESL